MKLMNVILGINILAATAFGTSPYGGPWVAKTVGKVNQDSVTSVCTIWPSLVRKFVYVKGKSYQTTQKINLNYRELSALIEEANSARVQVAAHIMEAIPNVKINAGEVANRLDDVLIFSDGGSLQFREGSAAKKLRAIANEYCGKMPWKK